MLGFGWLALRQAQEALTTGRLEEAQRLLAQQSIQGHRRHGELLRQLARCLVERGERHLRREDSEAAWRDLQQAEGLETADRSCERLRQALTRLGLAQVRALLQAGEPQRASRAIGQLRDHAARSAELQLLEETTRNWLTAQEQAEQGEFARAIETIDHIQRRLLGPSGPLEQYRQVLQERQRRFAAQLVRLHEAADAGNWREVLEVSEQVLAVAPQYAEARQARARAWQAVGPITVAFRQQTEEGPDAPPPADETPQRFFLWIDGVGGYLVCLGTTVTLGHASPDTHVDVPLAADVSRLHATVTRDAEGGYLLEASRTVQVNGQPATKIVLKPGDRITLGTSCQLLFQRPVPVSNSARLDLVSGHRVLPGVDGVLLMADNLVLGPGTQGHVPMPDLVKPIVLFRTKDGLGVRHAGGLTVDGQRVEDRAVLLPNSCVSGEDFAFAVEPVGAGSKKGRK
jgi:tetratricopeptide (TPR) repeat protein